MHSESKAVDIDFLNLRSPQMKAFHMSWIAFFLCFFAWFGVAPLMAVIRDELALTEAQVGNTFIASVAVTVIARPIIGRICDRYGPRLTYSALLVVGSIPVMAVGLARSYEAFLLFRLAIGAIGASFVVTQYHTSKMFAPNVVGSANAITAGWGNLGGGVTQLVMPLIFSAFLAMGVGEFWGWRLAMFVSGLICMGTGFAYYHFTQDTPAGNYSELRAREGESEHAPDREDASILAACRDYRVWILCVIYGACFGIELMMNNIAALYFTDHFDLSLARAGLVAGLFGAMNIFARPLGGYIGDRFAVNFGLRGRVWWLFLAMLLEGIALVFFAQANVLYLAIAALVPFSLLVQMAEGATYSVVPFVNRDALGSVAGIVGAGGNLGAVAAGFLFRGAFDWPVALSLLGGLVCTCSFLAFAVRFSPAAEEEAEEEMLYSLERAAEKSAAPTNTGEEAEPAPVEEPVGAPAGT